MTYILMFKKKNLIKISVGVENGGGGGHTYVASHTFVPDSAYMAPFFDLNTFFLKKSYP